MDLSEEHHPMLDMENEIKRKRKQNCDEGTLKKQQKVEQVVKSVENSHKIIEEQACCSNKVILHHSPKKRLELTETTKIKRQFIYGNYQQYYGYRNKNKDFHDVRLDILATQSEMFRDTEVLDIGCNSGFITMHIAQHFPIKNIVGLDIDRSLINQAQKQQIKLKKTLHPLKEVNAPKTFPFNVKFVHGNYVLRNDVLLEIEREQFDIILCLSITKWLHLNFGDNGIKQAFRRIFLQLRNGGKLILEAQPFDNYARRKKMTESIHANYKAMQFFPSQFDEYLLSSAVGFKSMQLLGTPEHFAAGFKRPIQIFHKQ